MVSASLGASKMRLDDNIDYSVGVVLYKEVGESVNIGDALCAVYVGNNINYLDPLDAFVIE